MSSSRPSLALRLGLDTEDPDDDGSLRTLLRAPSPLTLRLPQPPSARLCHLTLALAWLTAILLDAATTWVALQGQFREQNPLAAYLMSQLGVAPVLLVGSLLCCTMALVSWSRGGPQVLRSVRIALLVVLTLKLSAALHNLHLLT